MTTKTLQAGERCPTCGRRQGPLSPEQFRADVITPEPDPITVGHPPPEALEGARAASAAALEVLAQAHRDLQAARGRRARAGGGYQGGRNGRQYQPADRAAAEEAGAAIAAAKVDVEAAEAEAARLHHIVFELEQAHGAELRAARVAAYRDSVASREQEGENGIAKRRAGALTKMRQLLGVGGSEGG